MRPGGLRLANHNRVERFTQKGLTGLWSEYKCLAAARLRQSTITSILFTMSSLHPFDPITPGEIQLAVRILESAFPGVKLRHKRIDLQEPTKHEVVPFLEAERRGEPHPRKPARLLMTLFHRMDTGSFYKAVLNADTKSVVYAKELPKDFQVSGDINNIDDNICLPMTRVRWTWTR